MGFFCDQCRFTGDDHNLAIWAVLVQPSRDLKVPHCKGDPAEARDRVGLIAADKGDFTPSFADSDAACGPSAFCRRAR
jgi:hypothetical protein